MSELIALATILLTVLIGAVSPGPSFILVVRTSVARSRRHGLAAAMGMGVGGMAFSAAALFGLHAVFTHVAWLYAVLKVAGGLYLVYLAWRLWRAAREPLAMPAEGSASSAPWHKAFLTALTVQLSNPKTALFYASIFTAVLPAQPAAWVFVAVPPMVFLVEAAWYSFVALAFSSGPPRAAYLRSKLWIDRICGALMGAIGVKLIVSASASR
jgi:RhtB (resistance to homoserine/threonine) family protein